MVVCRPVGLCWWDKQVGLVRMQKSFCAVRKWAVVFFSIVKARWRVCSHLCATRIHALTYEGRALVMHRDVYGLRSFSMKEDKWTWNEMTSVSQRGQWGGCCWPERRALWRCERCRLGKGQLENDAIIQLNRTGCKSQLLCTHPVWICPGLSVPNKNKHWFMWVHIS